jgi:polycystin 1L2
MSTFKVTECLCYHLTTFGSDFYVPPNTIDFSNVWAKFKNLSDNAAVFATIISLIGLYIIIAIWARYTDKKDLIKWGASPLVDNLPSDGYYYLVSVQTGVGNDTSTKSNVGLLVVGEQAESGVRKLSDGKRKVKIYKIYSNNI